MNNYETVFILNPVLSEDQIEEAVKKYEKFQPDIILLDIMMPKMDGIEACEKIKSLDNYNDCTIIFLSARNEEFTQISFVNGIFTSKGGKHVDYVVNQIVRKITAYINNKKHVDVKPASIKEQLMIFINCTIENPAFELQIQIFR